MCSTIAPQMVVCLSMAVWLNKNSASFGLPYYSCSTNFVLLKFYNMKHFKIVPLSKEYAAKIRETNKDDFGHDVIEQVATGKGPCRVSLKPFVSGRDTRLLLSHSPFSIDNAYNQPGPIFINKNEVEPYRDIYRFPPEIKEDKKSFALSLIGYDKNQYMIFTQLVGDNDVDDLIEKIFAEQPNVEYLHARSSKACCFICKIERIESN